MSLSILALSLSAAPVLISSDYPLEMQAKVSPICQIHIWLEPKYIAKTFAITSKFDDTFVEKNKSDQEFISAVITEDFLRSMTKGVNFGSNVEIELEPSPREKTWDKNSIMPEMARDNPCYVELAIIYFSYGKAFAVGGSAGFIAERRRWVSAGKSNIRKIFGFGKIDLKPSAYSDPDKLAIVLKATAQVAFGNLIKEAIE